MTTRTRSRHCDGKIANSSRENALGQIARIASQRGASFGSYQAYRCRHCGAWHIGHRPKPRRKR